MNYLAYSSDQELIDSLNDCVHEYVSQNGKDPEVLILGYGSYIKLCLTWSDRFSVIGTSGIIWLTEFQGIRIVVDGNAEYRIAFTLADPRDAATTAFLEAHRKKGDRPIPKKGSRSFLI